MPGLASITVARANIARYNSRKDSMNPVPSRAARIARFFNIMRCFNSRQNETVITKIPRIPTRENAADHYQTAILRQNGRRTGVDLEERSTARSTTVRRPTQTSQVSPRNSRLIEMNDNCNDSDTIVPSSSDSQASNKSKHNHTYARNDFLSASTPSSSSSGSSERTLAEFVWLSDSIDSSRPVRSTARSGAWKCCKCGRNATANQDTCINQRCQHARCAAVCPAFL